MSKETKRVLSESGLPIGPEVNAGAALLRGAGEVLGMHAHDSRA